MSKSLSLGWKILGGILYLSKEFPQNKLPTIAYCRGLDNFPYCFLSLLSYLIVISPKLCF